MKILSSLHDAMFRAQQNVASYYLIIIDTYFGFHIVRYVYLLSITINVYVCFISDNGVKSRHNVGRLVSVLHLALR